MSTLRSDRARRRAARLRNTRIAIVVVVILIIAASAFFIWSSRSTKAPQAISEGNMITTASGLQYEDLLVGEGAQAQPGDTVSVHYTGWLQDGTKFDSSLDRGQPFTFTLGRGEVIKGWDEGVAGMRAGGKRRLVIPPDLGYGSQGAGGVIPPGATLIFEVELVEIK